MMITGGPKSSNTVFNPVEFNGIKIHAVLYNLTTPAIRKLRTVRPTGPDIRKYRTTDATDARRITQAIMVSMVQITLQNITRHLKVIYTEAKPSEAATCEQYLRVQEAMKWKLDEYLSFNERKVLPSSGAASKKLSDNRARRDCAQFAVRRWEFKEPMGEAESNKKSEGTAKQLEHRNKDTGGGNG